LHVNKKLVGGAHPGLRGEFPITFFLRRGEGLKSKKGDPNVS